MVFKKTIQQKYKYGYRRKKRIIEYINGILITSSYKVSDVFRIELLHIITEKGYTFDEVIDAVNSSKNINLRFDENDNVVDESVGVFLDKIMGFLINKRLPIIEKKINYTNGICRNRFSKYDSFSCRMLLEQYVDKLRALGKSEETIVSYFDEVIIPMSKKIEYFNWWEDTMTSWINTEK